MEIRILFKRIILIVVCLMIGGIGYSQVNKEALKKKAETKEESVKEDAKVEKEDMSGKEDAPVIEQVEKKEEGVQKTKVNVVKKTVEGVEEGEAIIEETLEEQTRGEPIPGADIYLEQEPVRIEGEQQNTKSEEEENEKKKAVNEPE